MIFKIFTLLENWLNLLQYTCNVFTTPLKCCHFTLQNVKRNKNDKLSDYTSFIILLWKLFSSKIGQIIWKDVYMSSIVLDNSLEALFSLINGESLPATPIWSSWPAETRSVHWVQQTLRLSSLMNGKTSWGCYQGQPSSHWKSFQIIWPILLFD